MKVDKTMVLHNNEHDIDSIQQKKSGKIIPGGGGPICGGGGTCNVPGGGGSDCSDPGGGSAKSGGGMFKCGGRGTEDIGNVMMLDAGTMGC